MNRSKIVQRGGGDDRGGQEDHGHQAHGHAAHLQRRENPLEHGIDARHVRDVAGQTWILGPRRAGKEAWQPEPVAEVFRSRRAVSKQRPGAEQEDGPADVKAVLDVDEILPRLGEAGPERLGPARRSATARRG